MQVLVNTDSSIEGSEGLSRHVEAEVQEALRPYSHQITTVQVHLSDANSHKQGVDDKRCMIEVRLAGMQPIAISHDAATVDQAIDGAAEKIRRRLDRKIGKRADQKGRTSYGGDPTL